MVETVDQADKLSKMRSLSQQEVAQFLGCSREYVSRLTNHKNEDRRLPAFRYTRHPKYSLEEVMWWREKHRYVPKRKGKR